MKDFKHVKLCLGQTLGQTQHKEISLFIILKTGIVLLEGPQPERVLVVSFMTGFNLHIY